MERTTKHEHGHHGHGHGGHGHHGHGHHHGNPHDRGLQGLVRYLTKIPWMWRSEVNTAVVGLVDPRPGERVVDLGAGFGAATMVAARTGATVIAVDPTPLMRRVLSVRKRLRPGRSGVAVHDGAAEALPVEDASIDALWSVNVMHHWTDLDAALREIHRALRPGGRVLLVDEDFDDPRHPWHERLRRDLGHQHRPFEAVDAADVAARMERAGFADVSGALGEVAGRPAKIVRGRKG